MKEKHEKIKKIKEKHKKDLNNGGENEKKLEPK